MEERCPILKELPYSVAEQVERLLGPEACVEYCYYTLDEPSEKAVEIAPGVWFENRIDDLGVYRVYVYHKGKWILFEEKPC